MSAETELLDNYFTYWQKSQSEFFQADTIKYFSHTLNPLTRTLATVKVRLDQKSILFTRKASTIFNGLESIGGFYESLRHIGLLLVIYFRDRLFKSSFLRQLYQVDAEVIPPRVKVPAPDEMIQEAEKEGPVQESYLKHILSYMLLRTRLTYDYNEIFHFLFCCRWIKLDKKSKTLVDKRHHLYHIGHEKLEKELDVINIIKNLRQLRLMTTFLLTKEQRTLLKFQRRNVIEMTSSSSDSDHHTYDTIKLLNSKRDHVKLQQAVKIKRHIN